MKLISVDLVMPVASLLVEATSTALNATFTSAGTADMCYKANIESIHLGVLCVDENSAKISPLLL